MNARHRNLLLTLLAAAAVLVALAATGAEAAGPSINAGPQAGIVWTRGLSTAAAHARHTQSPDLIYHGGPVMTSTSQVYPIFWGASWTGSSDAVAGMENFYSGVGNSKYAQTNTEYTDTSGLHVSPGVKLQTVMIDDSPAPSHAPQTSAVLAEVAKLHPSPTPNAYYPVYIDQPRGHANYCAWHSAGTIGGVTVQFGFFFKLDGDPSCDPQSPVTSYSEGVAALGNVSGHELSEMLTDPQLNAWYDSKGEENADKCAWTFGSSTLNLGGTQWKIQGNWSNAAYDSNQGYTDPTIGVVRGCIDGTNR